MGDQCSIYFIAVDVPKTIPVAGPQKRPIRQPRRILRDIYPLGTLFRDSGSRVVAGDGIRAPELKLALDSILELVVEALTIWSEVKANNE